MYETSWMLYACSQPITMQQGGAVGSSSGRMCQLPKSSTRHNSSKACLDVLLHYWKLKVDTPSINFKLSKIFVCCCAASSICCPIVMDKRIAQDFLFILSLIQFKYYALLYMLLHVMLYVLSYNSSYKWRVFTKYFKFAALGTCNNVAVHYICPPL